MDNIRNSVDNHSDYFRIKTKMKEEEVVELNFRYTASVGKQINFIDLKQFNELRKLTIQSKIKLPADFVNIDELNLLCFKTYHPELELKLMKLHRLVLSGLEIINLDENYLSNLPQLKVLNIGKTLSFFIFQSTLQSW